MRKAPNALLWIFNIFLAAVLVFKLHERDLENPSAPLSPTSSVDTSPLDADPTRSAQKTFSNRLTRSSEKHSLVAKILTTHWQQLGDLASLYEEDLDLNTPEGLRVLEETAKQIAEKLPAHALDFLDYFPPYKGVKLLEKEILAQWITQDKEQALAHFVTRGDYTTNRHLGALVGAFADRSSEELRQFFQWFDGLGDQAKKDSGDLEGTRYLQGAIAGQFVENLSVDDYPEAIKLLTKNSEHPSVGTHLVQLVSRYGEKNPEQSVDWLTNNRDSIPYDIYLDALDGLIEEWGGGKSPELASDLLSRDDFFAEIYRPENGDLSPEDRDKDMSHFFDRRLKSFLEASLGYYPEDAYFNANLIHDPTVRKKYLARAVEMIPELQSEAQQPPE